MHYEHADANPSDDDDELQQLPRTLAALRAALEPYPEALAKLEQTLDQLLGAEANAAASQPGTTATAPENPSA